MAARAMEQAGAQAPDLDPALADLWGALDAEGRAVLLLTLIGATTAPDAATRAEAIRGFTRWAGTRPAARAA